MPIRINLLAEAQAAEELRRKDPVKRAIIVASIIVAGFVAWSGLLQFRIIAARSQWKKLDAEWKKIEKGYEVVVENRRRTLDAEEKLAALQNYTTNRFLWGTTLNAFQQLLTGVDNIQVVRLKTEQVYVITEDPKANPKAPSRPATASEKIHMTIDAMDYSSPAGGQVNRFKENILTVPYFQASLQKTNGVLLNSLSAPQRGSDGREYVMFTLQGYFQEKTR